MKQDPSPQITLCIPVFNEEKALPDLFQNLSSYFGKFFIPFEVVVCLDPSTDFSENVLDQIAANHSFIQVIKNPRRLGRAESLRRALLAGNAPYLISASADLSVPLGDITKLLQSLTEAQASIAFGTRIDKKDSPFLSLNTKKNRLEISHLNILWERNKRIFKDPFSTSFILKNELKSVLNDIKGEGWYLTPTLQKEVLKRNIPYIEVPVHANSGQAKHFPYLRESLRLFFWSLRS